MSNTAEIDRPLGFFEWLFWLIEHAGRVNFVVIAEVTGPLTPDVLRKALDEVQASQPLLRVGLTIGAGKRLTFKAGSAAPVPLRIVSARPEAWIAEAERDRHQQLPLETGPLCACTMLDHGNQRATVLFTISHIIGDGISGLFFARLVLRAAGAIAAGKRAVPSASTAIQAIDELLPPWTRGLKGTWNSLAHRRAHSRRRKQFGQLASIPLDDSAPFHERRTRLVPHLFDVDSTHRLLQRVRREKVSLHSVLAAAQLRAIAAEFEDQQVVPQSLISGTSVRGRLEPRVANESLGLYASMVESTHRVEKSASLWQLAREVNGELWRQLKSGVDLLTLAKSRPTFAAMRWWLPPTDRGRQRFLRMLSRSAGPASMISVIPRGEQIVRAGDYGPLTIERLHGFGAGPRTPLFSMSTLSHGRISWNFVYLEPILSRQRARRIAQRAVQEIQ